MTNPSKCLKSADSSGIINCLNPYSIIEKTSKWSVVIQPTRSLSKFSDFPLCSQDNSIALQYACWLRG